VKNAKDYATLAARAGQLAAEVDPPDNDACADSLKLAKFYLRSAAAKLQATAEFKAEREKVS